MPQPKKGARLGGSPAHQKLIVANLATQLFQHGKITTTEARARFLRPVAEKLITKAKRGDLHNRREVLKTVRDKSVVHTLFTEIAPTFAERPGGYTRITKLSPRKGDNAPMAVIELVTEAYAPKTARPARGTTLTIPATTAEDSTTEDSTVEDSTAEAEDAQVEETAAADAPTDGSADAAGTTPEWAGSHAPLEDLDRAPEGFPVKGNADSMKFHEPDGQWFGSTVAEVWFDTAASAEAAGFTKAGS